MGTAHRALSKTLDSSFCRACFHPCKFFLRKDKQSIRNCKHLGHFCFLKASVERLTVTTGADLAPVSGPGPEGSLLAVVLMLVCCLLFR